MLLLAQSNVIDACIAKLAHKTLDQTIETLDPSSNLEDDLSLDIVDYMTLACDLEERFLLNIPDVEISNWTTVGDVHRTIQALLATTTLNLTEEQS